MHVPVEARTRSVTNDAWGPRKLPADTVQHTPVHSRQRGCIPDSVVRVLHNALIEIAIHVHRAGKRIKMAVIALSTSQFIAANVGTTSACRAAALLRRRKPSRKVLTPSSSIVPRSPQ